MSEKQDNLTEKELSFVKECRYCSSEICCVGFGQNGYPYRGNYGYVWLCLKCGARVGTHKGTKKPLGYPGDTQTQELRKKAHSLFDPIWRNKEMKRKEAYARMAEYLGIPEEKAHISQLELDQLLLLIKGLYLRRQNEQANEGNS